MTLATRCPSCGTVFRVVQDQLRVSEGWVRCGRCDHVFHAVEVLFDIDSGEPVQWPLPSEAEVAAPEVLQQAPPPEPLPTWAHDGPVEPRFVDEPMAPEPAGRFHREEPLLRAPSRGSDDDDIVITDHFAPASTGHERGLTAEDGQGPPLPAEPLAPAMVTQAPASAVEATPSFMRTAERGGKWRKPAVRLAMGLGLPVLAAALLVQVALLWRDPLAAHLPPLTPALQALCKVAGCSVQPLRRIELLAVESSGLNRLEGSAQALYRLQLVLRNRADTAVMPPSIDLSLTDNQGRLVARRVLAPADLALSRMVTTAIPPGADVPVRLVLSTGDRRVDGYTVELFYP